MTASRLVIRTVRYGGVWASLLAVTSLAQAGASILLPATLGRAVDGVLRGSTALTWPLLYAGLVALSMAGSALTELSVGAATANATARLRHRFIRHVLGLGALGARGTGLSAGDLTSRAVTAEAKPISAQDLVTISPEAESASTK